MANKVSLEVRHQSVARFQKRLDEMGIHATSSRIGAPDREMRDAMIRVCEEVVARARKNRKFGKGPYAYQSHPRTGRLEKAIKYSTTFDKRARQMVGTVYIDDSVAVNDRGQPYGQFVHEGTRPHSIDPRGKFNYMAFFWRPRSLNPPKIVDRFYHFWHVDHPGYAGDAFITRAIRQVRRTGYMYDTMSAAMKSAMRRGGK